MAEPRRAARAGAGSDGVRITAGRRSRKEKSLLLAAVLLMGLSALGVARWFRVESSRRAAPAIAPHGMAAPAPTLIRGAAHVDAIPRRIEPGEVEPPVASDAASSRSEPSPPVAQPATSDDEPTPPADGGPPTHEEPPFTVGPPGSGIAAFPPPGTNPIKIGIVVPDDFELPEGFVRHYQVTDDGRDLPPILMFNPDYEWIDAEGRRIEIPANHIVPPELAPPGLPIRMLEVPKKPGAP